MDPAILAKLSCNACETPLTPQNVTTLGCGHSQHLDCTPTVDCIQTRATTARKCSVLDCTAKDRVTKSKDGIAKVDRKLARVLELIEIATSLGKLDVSLTGEAIVPVSSMDGEVEGENESKRIHPGSEEFESNKKSRTSKDGEEGEVVGEKVAIDGTAIVVADEPPPTILEELLAELECQVCTQLLFKPSITPCGHTFCSICLARSLDHSDSCSLCREKFPSVPYVQAQPPTILIQEIIASLFPKELADRIAEMEDAVGSADAFVPIFVCALAWPGIASTMHIFEPRYRLMMRRAMETNKEFGMLVPLDASGRTAEYGTMLKINNLELLPDGRSLVESVGTYRFKVLEKGTLDGYMTAKIEKIVDVSAEVEAELEQTALFGNITGDTGATTPPASPSRISLRRAPAPIALTTQQLMLIAVEFTQSIPRWIRMRLTMSIGTMPTNPSDFTYWLAEVIPMEDEDKITLLAKTSVRERLVILTGWIAQIRAGMSSQAGGCGQM